MAYVRYHDAGVSRRTYHDVRGSVAAYIPEEEDEFLSRLSVLEFVLGVKHSVATLTQLFRLLQVLHEVLIRRTCNPVMQRYTRYGPNGLNVA